MANRKQPYNWKLVKPGDIISFRYKSKSTGRTVMQSILVLNPRLNVTLKNGKSTKHLIGIKLEESNKISIRLTRKELRILEKIGEFKKIDNENNLYRLEIDRRFILNDIKGIKEQAYDKISKSFNIQGQYRTYDYMKAKKSAVYLEPIRVFTKVEDTDED
ncbi:MAG: hypothetical protein CBC24_09575 [Candidatus Pelagibacter sp. TMED64]|nr:MAG: hypothetical protein CBC24_09575 [Candidatus Pelagibacter sp. TMED64]|tara:strand:+ start:462 stop:941 length:480 start_codon:yes stop_codon:yes gene_type:complete